MEQESGLGHLGGFGAFREDSALPVTGDLVDERLPEITKVVPWLLRADGVVFDGPLSESGRRV